MIKKSISVPIAPVHNSSSFRSEMVTQCLMWDLVEILSLLDDWCEIRTSDKYNGWIHSFYLSELEFDETQSLVVNSRFLPIFCSDSSSSNILYLLSFGTKVPLVSNASGFVKVPIGISSHGYIEAPQNIYSKNRNSISNLAESLIGVPYLWGGKSSFGLDCSGFVQLVFMVTGVNLPRDSSLQYEIDQLEQIELDKSLPGDLIFFLDKQIVNHVGIIFDKYRFIHCSGSVKLESLVKPDKHFNLALGQMKYVVKSVSRFLDI